MRARVITSVIVAIALLPTVVAGQESLASARDLYAAASYEDALSILNRLHPNDRSLEEARAIEQYRALCLLALGRVPEAEHAIESVIVREPSYRPHEGEVSPRVRAMYVEARRRMLPAIAERRYADAKAAFERKEFAIAAGGFEAVVNLLNDPEVAAAANQPVLADIKLLAAGFRDLSATAAAPPPAPPPPPVVATAPALPPPPMPTPASPSARPDPNRIYNQSDANVLPPIVVRQDFPIYAGSFDANGQGTIEVVVDETGEVIGAVMKAGVHPAYDPHVLRAARSWRYQPATLNGEPVKYRKAIQIELKTSK